MARKKPPVPPPLPLNELLTMQQVQDALRCSRAKIYMLVRQGRLRLVKFDRSARITATSLQQLIQEIANAPPPPPAPAETDTR
jgi:excisionase family DNA binding protein